MQNWANTPSNRPTNTNGKPQSIWKTVPFITDSGKTTKRMEEANRYGRMEHSTRAIGRMIWLTERVDLFNREEIATKGSGLMIRLKARAFTIITMALPILESGIMTSSMGMATNNGAMDQNTKETTLKV
jgi:hypothetical protein